MDRSPWPRRVGALLRRRSSDADPSFLPALRDAATTPFCCDPGPEAPSSTTSSFPLLRATSRTEPVSASSRRLSDLFFVSIEPLVSSHSSPSLSLQFDSITVAANPIAPEATSAVDDRGRELKLVPGLICTCTHNLHPSPPSCTRTCVTICKPAARVPSHTSAIHARHQAEAAWPKARDLSGHAHAVPCCTTLASSCKPHCPMHDASPTLALRCTRPRTHRLCSSRQPWP